VNSTTKQPKREYSSARDRLKSLTVSRIVEPGVYHDGGGLYLQVSLNGTKSWFFRYRLHGRVRDMGLGSFLDFSLAEARERARLQRQLVADKIDPIDKRDATALQERAKVATQITFEECAHQYHGKKKGGWKNPKHRAQWINTLTTYAFPTIGKSKVHTIRKANILAVLNPIWNEKPETASRVRQRIKTVLDWAAAMDFYPDYPHGMWVEIGKALVQNADDSVKKHHAACPYAEVSQVIAAVRSSNSKDIVKLAFEFTVLTAARSGESRGTLWSEIDWTEKLWKIPDSRMKAKKEHRVPLSNRCVEILKEAQKLTGSAKLVFCHSETKKPYSDAVFTSLIRKGLGLPHTMHGFRSSFRDWGGEKTEHARELLEVSLAHLTGDQTESAYWRGDVIERRRALMEDWAKYATTVNPVAIPAAES
jgi:integrase